MAHFDFDKPKCKFCGARLMSKRTRDADTCSKCLAEIERTYRAYRLQCRDCERIFFFGANGVDSNGDSISDVMQAHNIECSHTTVNERIAQKMLDNTGE